MYTAHSLENFSYVPFSNWTHHPYCTIYYMHQKVIYVFVFFFLGIFIRANSLIENNQDVILGIEVCWWKASKSLFIQKQPEISEAVPFWVLVLLLATKHRKLHPHFISNFIILYLLFNYFLNFSNTPISRFSITSPI